MEKPIGCHGNLEKQDSVLALSRGVRERMGRDGEKEKGYLRRLDRQTAKKTEGCCRDLGGTEGGQGQRAKS